MEMIAHRKYISRTYVVLFALFARQTRVFAKLNQHRPVWLSRISAQRWQKHVSNYVSAAARTYTRVSFQFRQLANERIHDGLLNKPKTCRVYACVCVCVCLFNVWMYVHFRDILQFRMSSN